MLSDQQQCSSEVPVLSPPLLLALGSTGTSSTFPPRTTSLTLTGGPASQFSPKTLQPLKNSFLIGGMTVPGDQSLHGRTYDNNPFHFEIPEQSNDNITVSFQSSLDEWYDERQDWQINATRMGDCYDLTGTWISKLPDNNKVNFPGVPGADCWMVGRTFCE